MNSIAFGAKRAFHGFLRITRKPFASLGLTAARFDLLHVLQLHEGDEEFPWPTMQSELRQELGVHASVVSRMLRALEKLGLVTRERDLDDRRQISVSLTERGRKCIRAAHTTLVRAVRRLVYRAICCGRHRDANARFRHMDNLEGYLRVLRHDFGDIATLYYPWGHPDD